MYQRDRAGGRNGIRSRQSIPVSGSLCWGGGGSVALIPPHANCCSSPDRNQPPVDTLIHHSQIIPVCTAAQTDKARLLLNEKEKVLVSQWEHKTHNRSSSTSRHSGGEDLQKTRAVISSGFNWDFESQSTFTVSSVSFQENVKQGE